MNFIVLLAIIINNKLVDLCLNSYFCKKRKIMKKILRNIVAVLTATAVIVFLVALCYKNYDVEAYSFVASLFLLPIWYIVHIIVDYPDWENGGGLPPGFGG